MIDTQGTVSDPSTEFMLSELNHHQEVHREISHHVVNRVNLHIAVVSAAFTVPILFFEELASDPRLLLLVALLFAGVLAVGLLVYAELVQWVISTIFSARRADGIKRFFYDLDPRLDFYLSKPYDDRDVHLRRRGIKAVISTDLGSKQIVTILNNFVAAVAAACFTRGLDVGGWLLAVLVGAVFFLMTWVLQFYYARIRYQLAEEVAEREIKFPRPTE